MSGPAIAFLEMSRPLNALAAAAITFFAPLASILANPTSVKHFAEFLEKRGSVDVLVHMLEAAEQAQRERTR